MATTILEQNHSHRYYFAGIAMLSEMLAAGLIDTDDYIVLESRFAGEFSPLFRYEKPCQIGSVPVRQCEQKEVA